MKHEFAAGRPPLRRPHTAPPSPVPRFFALFLAGLVAAPMANAQSTSSASEVTVLYRVDDASFGQAVASISSAHEVDATASPGDSVALSERSELEASAFFEKAGAPGEALLFLPEEGSDLDESLRWAGKIAHELELGGTALVFTYSGTVDAALPALADFLVALEKESSLERIEVVTHGDGSTLFNRAMLAARKEGFDLAVGGAHIDYGAEAAASSKVTVKLRGTTGKGTPFTTRGVTRGAPAPGAPAPTLVVPEEPDEESNEYHTVDVYYGTDRKPTTNTTENDRYGTDRNRAGPMEYGRTTISIPLHHKIGVVERPKWYKLEFSENPKKHVTILELEKMSGESFFAEVGGTAAEKQKNEALLFIHGFNVPFDDAVRRTGQIAFDLDFGGVALAFSWPSQGSLKAYTIDEANAEWAIPHLTHFLMDLQEKTDVEKIHVIAHSMGTRVLSYALANAKDEGFDLDLNNVILAAPDIDVDVFKDQILPKITEASDTLTMYASSDDTALKVSQTIHGVARLGLSGDHILVTPGMDTINASGIDTSMIGHGYYGSAKVVVTDIFNLVIKGLEPPKRKLIPGTFGEWDFGELRSPD